MNPPKTYAQALRLRKIQNRSYNGEDKFSVGKRGEPINFPIDPVTKARKLRRSVKRPEIIKKRIKTLESKIIWEQKFIDSLDKKHPKIQRLTQEALNNITTLQHSLMFAKQSLSTMIP
jgi:hypothetical protein